MANMDNEQIKVELKKYSDEAYQKFSASLLPGINNIIGVRLPELRKMARRLARTDWRQNLHQLSDDTFEEIMLQGMMIGYVDCPIEGRLDLIRKFVPKIDNWSVCDSFCSGLKLAQSERERYFQFLQPYLKSTRGFEQRFAAVMLLDYYIDKEWILCTIKALKEIDAEAYYAKMAVSWALAECYLSFPKETMPVICDDKLDLAVRQKALQKIIQSRTISPQTRDAIRALKNDIS